MPADETRRSAPAPLLPVALAASAGIVIDRLNAPFTVRGWAALAAGLALLATWLCRRGGAGPWRLALFLGLTALGGAWHHYRWMDPGGADLSGWIDETPRPSWVRGVLVSVPEFRAPEFPGDTGTTRVLLAITGVQDGRRWHPRTGRALVTISGDRADLRMGRAVTAAGSLAAVAGPRNPGQYDARAALRAEGVRLRLSIGEPESIQEDRGTPDWPLTETLGRLRRWSAGRLNAVIDPSVAPLAAALVLGRREAIDPEVIDAFAETGTTHLLAISGLHLQTLATAVFLAAGLLRLGTKRSVLLVMVVTVAYAILVGMMPSVVRSAAMTLGFCLAGLLDRQARAANMLAFAAIVTLLHNPSHLFDAGCQLSFLAVAAILWGLPLAESAARCAITRVRLNLSTWRLETTPADDPLDALERRYAPAWKRGIGRMTSAVQGAVGLSVIVWLVTAPLIAYRFHMISPVGTILNVPLVPLSSLALLASGAAMAVPTLVGRLAHGLLAGTLTLVRWGTLPRWGHLYTAGPPGWWVAGVYVLLAGLVFHRQRRKWLSGGLAVWVALPVAMAALPAGPATPEAEFLDVGHGLAVMIRTTPGRATLYDCGRLRDPHVGRRLIARALWERGVRRLDRVILSHADADHYNGLPELARRFPIDEVVVTSGFGVRPGEPAELLGAMARGGTPTRRVAAGETIDLGGGLVGTVLHPPENWSPDAPDNDHSLVLDLAYQGRHLLLTGDLDGEGRLRLLERPAADFDVMLAPHHGGRSANPVALYDWGNPRRVVVSSRPVEPGFDDPLGFLPGRGVPVLRTGERGAIRLRWTDDGLLVGDDPARERTESSRRDRGNRMGLSLWVPSAGGWIVGIAGLVAGLAAVGVLAIVEWGAWVLIRPGGSLAETEPEPPPWEPLTITAADGVALSGAWVRGDGGRTALLLHGFGESRAALRERGEALARRGWNVALADARGRGDSGGWWTTFGVREATDVHRWLEALAERVGPEFQPIVWGRSMGAAIALRAAAEDPRIAALVLEAPYADLRSSVAEGLQRKRLPRWLARPMIWRAGRIAGAALDVPPPVELAGQVARPVLIVHGADDAIAPASEVRRLAAAFPETPTMIEVPSARHADVFEVGGRTLEEAILAFLGEKLPAPPGR